MPAISGMVLTGQNPSTRIQNVIDGASWITLDDMPLVLQGKDQILTRIANEEWEAPYVWRIRWINIPAQEAQQSMETEMEQVNAI